MTEFDSSVNLDVEISDRSLKAARDEIESELGGVAAAVSADAGGGAGGGVGRQRRRRRLEFRWNRENNENLAAILSIIDDAEFGGDGGGILGGIGGELLGAGAETAGDVAIETADTAADIIQDTLTGTVSTALGNTIADSISGSTVTLESDSVMVEQPSWLPLQVTDPSPLGVEEAGPFPVTDPSPLGVSDPSPLGVSDPSPLGVSDPSPLAVEDVPPIPVEDPGDMTVTVNVNASGMRGGSAARGSPADLAEAPLSRHVGRTASKFGEMAPGGQILGGLLGVGTFLGQEIGGANRITPGVAGFRGNPETQRQYERAMQRQRERQFGTGARSRMGGDTNVTVEMGSTSVDVTPEADQIAQEVSRELQREYDRLISDIEQRLSDVEDQIDSVSGGVGIR